MFSYSVFIDLCDFFRIFHWDYSAVFRNSGWDNQISCFVKLGYALVVGKVSEKPLSYELIRVFLCFGYSLTSANSFSRMAEFA